jgi:hypothetical protein
MQELTIAVRRFLGFEVVVCLFLIPLLTGCGKPITKTELPGTYVADFGFATDTLAIKADGSFTQTIKIKAGGKIATVNGTWHFDPKKRWIHFSEFMVVIDGFDEMVPNFDAPENRQRPHVESVRRMFGKLEIGGDDLPWGRTGVLAPYTKQ